MPPVIVSGWPRDVVTVAGGAITLRCPGTWDWDMDLFWVFSYEQAFKMDGIADLDRIHNYAIRQHDVSWGGGEGGGEVIWPLGGGIEYRSMLLVDIRGKNILLYYIHDLSFF